MRFPLLLLSALLLPACADLADDDLPEGEDGVGDYDEATTDDKADAVTEIRARIDGLTVWVDPVARHTAAGWVVDGRASRNLEDVMSFVPDDPFATAAITGLRTFTITFERTYELNTMMSGLPIFLQVNPVTGESATAAVWLSPRLTSFSGSSRVYLDSTLVPVWIGGQVVYRGGASTASGWGDLAVWSDGGAGPQVFAQPARRFRIDWRYDVLATAGALPGAPIHAAAYKNGATAEKRAAFQVRIARLALTRLDPYEVWQRTCHEDVRSCLGALPAGTVDASACGSYFEVQSCGGLDVADVPTAASMADDFRLHLVRWYADHGADVVAAGGNSLAAAQAAVDPASFTEVTSADEDPYAHDLGTVWVFRHPDVAYPGSDIAWFSVYRKTNGTLVEIYDFN